ncbi:DUF2948 family protein [Ciceribacter sp. L1K23]|uniref:DUF2948 family protein n=1 Tax=unclassified Ciceribacter TaxID=2628820 RepID=UPI001ABE5235|nr:MULTISPECIES: DUF2948 family protein [unclassified Ciceribacter]MBO3758417.1 DUF2948 family protein [Ciceribacter sp. L1K22]MBR0557259.1 DUF2948 family protein [Ciceribacter sp. L1K23]
MESLKLMALDGDDLAIVSAHMQDAVFKVGDITFSPKGGHFALAANRFVWEKANGQRKTYERRRAVISFKRVRAVRSAGVDRSRSDDVKSLLALRYLPDGEGPDGKVELVLSGGGMIVLDVECIEAQLADTGGAWEASSLPRHIGD